MTLNPKLSCTSIVLMQQIFKINPSKAVSRFNVSQYKGLEVIFYLFNSSKFSITFGAAVFQCWQALKQNKDFTINPELDYSRGLNIQQPTSIMSSWCIPRHYLTSSFAPYPNVKCTTLGVEFKFSCGILMSMKLKIVLQCCHNWVMLALQWGLE